MPNCINNKRISKSTFDSEASTLNSIIGFSRSISFYKWYLYSLYRVSFFLKAIKGMTPNIKNINDIDFEKPMIELSFRIDRQYTVSCGSDFIPPFSNICW